MTRKLKREGGGKEVERGRKRGREGGGEGEEEREGGRGTRSKTFCNPDR